MIHFKCPHCGTALQMETHYAGQAVLCPTCNGQILVPHPSASAKAVICICPYCKALYQILPELTGRRIQCPTCKKITHIPDQENTVSQSQMLRFSCRSCGQPYAIPARYVGRKFTCPACRHACLVPTPKPAEKELILLEEKPPKDQTSQLPSEPAPQEQEKEPAIFDSSPIPKKSALLKRLPGAVLAILVVSITTWALLSSEKDKTDSPHQEPPLSPQNYPQSIDFSRSIITQLNRKSDNIKELIYLFPDQIEVSEQAIESLINALDIGRFSSLETNLENARVEPGASYFITKTLAKSDTGQIRIIRIGFVEIENINFTDESVSLDRLLFAISIFDVQNTLLASAGQTKQEELISLLDETVNKYAVTSQKTSEKHSSETIYTQIVEKFYCPIAIVLLLVGLSTIISIWVVFDKAGEPGWAVFVPIYNTIVFARIGGKSEWLGFLCALSPMIPFVGSILNLFLFLYLSVSVAKAFGKGTLFGFGMVFLPFLFFPILAFSESAYPQADV